MTQAQPSVQKSTRRSRRRGGYLYVAVLFTSLIIVAVVTASLTLSTASTRSEFDRINRISATRLAESELHRVATQLSSNDQWRTQHTNATFTEWISLRSQSGNVDSGVISSDNANSLVRYQLSDADGDLADDPHDEVVLTTHAQVGQSHVAISATLQGAYPALPILNYLVTATDDLEIESSKSLSAEGKIQVDDDCKSDAAGILTTPTLECSGDIQFYVRGDVTSSNVILPNQDIIDFYAEQATNLPVASLPSVSGWRQMQDIVLSPTENPYGPTSAAGVYRIDAQGNDIQISNCRIKATLVIENCPLVELSGGITWSYPEQADAILVADGNIRFLSNDPSLSESIRNTNFNPASTPYRNTQSNANQSDIFPTELRGIIYADNHILCYPLTDDSPLKITGALICRDLRIHGNVSIARLSELVDSPPVAFSDWQPLQFVRGSFRRVETP
ncbi:MAG: hypothetical protein WBD20_21480 [Pirellulaceae bacterium]